MALTVYQSQDQTFMLQQKQWASQLNPLLANNFTQGLIISNLPLLASTPLTFNHFLGKQMTGWIVIDNTAFCDVKRTEPLNSTTLTLEASADTSLSLWVF